MNRKALVVIVIVVLLGALAAVLWPGARASAPLPAASAYLKEETSAGIKDFIKAQNSPVVLVNFWASWCEPCKLEFPMILELREKYAARGLKVVFVSIDETADIPTAEAFLKEQKFEVKSFVKGTQSLQMVADIFPGWKGAVPMTLLFGPDLKLLDSWEGDASLQEFEKRIAPYLRGI